MALLETTFERNSIVSIRASSDGGSSVGACEHRGSSTIVAANRLSAPECGSDTTGICIHKSRTSSSLDDVNESQFCHFYHFYRTMLCIAWTMPSQDVSPSVCPSHASILSKWLHVSSDFFTVG